MGAYGIVEDSHDQSVLDETVSFSKMALFGVLEEEGLRITGRNAVIRWLCGIGLFLTACASVESTPHAASAEASDVLVLTGRVIDGTGAEPIADGIVVVDGESVRCAGPRAACDVPRGARVIDVESGTILPGLIDLHAHVRPHYLSFFLAAGVTSVRDASNNFEMLEGMGRDGPGRARLFWSGPAIDGEGSVLGQTALRVRSADDGRAAVDSLVARGVDVIKLYQQISTEAFHAATRRAREHGLPVATDLGLQVGRGLTVSEVDALEAIEAGVTSIEHASGFALAFRRLGGDPARDPLDAALVDSLARALVAYDVVLVPTLGLTHSFASETPPSIEGVPLASETPPDMIEWWRTMHASLSREARVRAAADYRLAAALVRRVAELGGRIGAGTDTPAGPLVLPGGGLHRELELLVEAGLSPLQAIHAATGEAARTLGRPERGVIAAQKVADLLVVDGDPSVDIHATRRIRHVIKAGRVLSPDSLRAHARASTTAN